jgi:nucleotide-binding universal stress UspA family protein
MFGKILVAFDGSKPSEKALDTAIELAKKFDSVIHLVSVITLPDYAVLKNEVTEVQEEEGKFYQELQNKAIESRKSEVEIKPVIIYGHPTDRILDYAKSKNFDLVVVGSRGLSTTKRFFLGSVSDKVSHFSPCPILIVR